MRVPAPVVPYVLPMPSLYDMTPLPQAEEVRPEYGYRKVEEVEEEEEEDGDQVRDKNPKLAQYTEIQSRKKPQEKKCQQNNN